MDGLVGSLIYHQPYAFQTKHIRDFMRVNKHGCGSVDQYRARKLAYSQHARFNMHMRVQQTRNQKPTGCLDDLGIGPNRMRCIFSNVSNPAIFHSYVDSRDDLARLHTNPISFLDYQVSRSTAHSRIYQGTRGFGIHLRVHYNSF